MISKWAPLLKDRFTGFSQPFGGLEAPDLVVGSNSCSDVRVDHPYHLLTSTGCPLFIGPDVKSIESFSIGLNGSVIGV